MEFTNLVINDGNTETLDYDGKTVISFLVGYGKNPSSIGEGGPWSVETQHLYEGNYYTADKTTSLTSYNVNYGTLSPHSYNSSSYKIYD